MLESNADESACNIMAGAMGKIPKTHEDQKQKKCPYWRIKMLGG